jgi:hypothetical protein
MLNCIKASSYKEGLLFSIRFVPALSPIYRNVGNCCFYYVIRITTLIYRLFFWFGRTRLLNVASEKMVWFRLPTKPEYFRMFC